MAAASSGVRVTGGSVAAGPGTVLMPRMVVDPSDSFGSAELVGSAPEASGCLVTPAASKADVTEQLGQAGSIPVRLRQTSPAPTLRGDDHRSAPAGAAH